MLLLSKNKRSFISNKTMLYFLARAFHYYRLATGVVMLSPPERIFFDLVFLLTAILFIIGLFKLALGTYQSFMRLIIFDENTRKRNHDTTDVLKFET